MKTILVVACILFVTSLMFAAGPSELLNPPTFSSSNGVLDLLITAKVKVVPFETYSPASWVYEVCYRSDSTNNVCPSDSRTASEYGGMRLQLNQGDHLKVRFINQLPPAPPDAEHAQEMPEMLGANPTNLHTHGLIVEPRQATASNPTYGDYVYVYAYPKGKLPTMSDPGLDYTDQPLDYDIYIPPNHPSGLFWIHPHVHGLALNQISYGMAGIITVGSSSGYIGTFTPLAAGAPPATPPVRYLTLKDIEILPDSSVLSQEDPDFCEPDPDPTEPARDGFCPGIDDTGEGGGDYVGGKWFFTVNGQIYPTITLAQNGEIWRITHASGSRSYQLSLIDDATGQPRPFQVIALDGVTIDNSAGVQAVLKAAGGKFVPVACSFTAPGTTIQPVCASSLRMMPSSRVELYVPPSTQGGSATLLTRSYATGPAGDDWPSANLAHVAFTPGLSSPLRGLNVKGVSSNLVAKTGLLGAPIMIDGVRNSANISLQSAPQLLARMNPADAAILKEHLSALSAPAPIPSAPCTALPAGHHRRIFFGVPADDEDAFGLGYEEVDQRGDVVPGTFRDIMEFHHNVIDVCLPLGKGNSAVSEPWELVNVAGEDHNFHIHQTKFFVLMNTAPGALVDNIPAPHGSDACDGSIATWRSGACQVKSVYVSIPFSEVGDFVYHCHILEHEDGGMMAHIRVVPYQ
jgi:FtsP/CotA-like multicopper oxidase with cupredoxin domain